VKENYKECFYYSYGYCYYTGKSCLPCNLEKAKICATKKFTGKKKYPDCTEPKWEEEFIDTLNNISNVGFSVQSLGYLIEKYLTIKRNNFDKVKIKCKDGLIQIERI